MIRRRGTGGIEQQTIRRIAPEPFTDGHRVVFRRRFHTPEQFIDGDIQRIGKTRKRLRTWLDSARFIFCDGNPVQGSKLGKLILAQTARHPEIPDPVTIDI